MKKTKKLLAFVLAVAVFYLGMPIESHGEEVFTESNNAVIFVLDSSGSMLSSDPGYRTKESLDMALHILPEDTEVGIISFSDQINVNTGLRKVGDPALQTGVDSIKYSGNTNTAAGIAEAVTQLEKSTATHKKIILLADGELYLGSGATESKTASANQMLDEAILKANHLQIPVDSLILTQNFDGDIGLIQRISTETGGVAKEYPNVDALIQGIEDVCLPYYEKNLYSVTSVDTIDNQQEITLSIPTAYIQEVRVFFSTYTPVSGVSFQTHQEDMDIISNSVYSFLTIKNPQKEDLVIRFSSTTNQPVKVYYIVTYDVKTTGTVESNNNQSLKEQTNLAVFDVLDSETGESILTSGDFASFIPLITFTKDGESVEVQGEISGGKIRAEIPDLGYGEIESTVLLESDSLRINGGETSIDVVDILTPAIQRRQQMIAISIVSGVLVLAGLIFLLTRQKKRPEFLPDTKSSKDQMFAFSGKLDCYVTALSDWEHAEIAPFSFYLHSIKRQAEVPFQEILEECGIRYTFGGSGKLIFSPGPDKTLYVKNKGQNTVLLRGAVMERGKTYRLAFGDKLYFTAEDGLSEIAIYYRNIARQETTVYRNGAVSYRA